VPKNQEFIEETDAVVECPAFFGVPPGNMIWTRDNLVINVDDRFISEDGRLTILNIQENDEGVYRCSIHLLGIVDSEYITVDVLERNSLAPRIVEPLYPIEVVYSDSLNLHCQLEEPMDVYYTWTVDTSSELRFLTNTTPSFHRDVDKFVGGRYTCRVENNYGYDEQIYFVRILGKVNLL
jgi:hypothetical protein